MMLAAFSALSLALVLAFARARGLSLAALACAFGLATGLFLWEVWSPEYGFRMPWLQGALPVAPGRA
jgi:hypothetical protein